MGAARVKQRGLLVVRTLVLMSMAVLVLSACVFLARLHRRDGAIVIRRHVRQLPHKRDDVPDLIVIMALSPGGHPRGLDAVLDRPERHPRIDWLLQRKSKERAGIPSRAIK